jgi:flagellar protein FlbB
MAYAGAGSRIFVLFLLIAALGLGGVLWFDYLGLLDAKETFAPALRLVGIRPPTKVEDLESPVVLDIERTKKQWEALELKREELDARETALDEQEQEIVQMLDALEEEKKALEEREKTFNDLVNRYENRDTNLRQIAAYLEGMPPEAAVERILKMDDQDAIDLLRTSQKRADESGETSIVAYWMTLMPPERAAQLKRKMLLKPGG